MTASIGRRRFGSEIHQREPLGLGLVEPDQINVLLPLATGATGVRRTVDELARATAAAIASAPQGREAEALVAYVLAWHHHFPAAFAAAHGDAAAGVLAWARSSDCDAGRYLKLCRIAIENLAGIL